MLTDRSITEKCDSWCACLSCMERKNRGRNALRGVQKEDSVTETPQAPTNESEPKVIRGFAR